MKIFTGIVTETKMAKTATVEVRRFVVHPMYKKRIKKVKKYLVHDELGAEKGQKVHFAASKPYSKLKRWKLLDIVDTKKETIREKTSKTAAKPKKKVHKKKK